MDVKRAGSQRPKRQRGLVYGVPEPIVPRECSSAPAVEMAAVSFGVGSDSKAVVAGCARIIDDIKTV